MANIPLFTTMNHIPPRVGNPLRESQTTEVGITETIDLAPLTKQAHWTVRGPQFIAVHQMLDTLRTDLDEAADTIAKWVV